MAEENEHRSGGDPADRRAAGLPDHGLRQVQVPREKKAHEAKIKQKQIQVKEVKFRPGTDEGDYKIKLRNLTASSTEGDKIKVTIRFRGREMAHQELGMQLLKRVEADLKRSGRGRAVAEARRPADDHDAGARRRSIS